MSRDVLNHKTNKKHGKNLPQRTQRKKELTENIEKK